MPAYPSSPAPRRIPREAFIDPKVGAEFESGHAEGRPRWHRGLQRFELHYECNKADRDAIFNFLKARRLGVERFDYTPHYAGSPAYQVIFEGDEVPFERIVEGPAGELYAFTVVLREAF